MITTKLSLKSARIVLAVEVKHVQHAAWIVYESHLLNDAKVDDTVNLSAELLDTGILLA